MKSFKRICGVFCATLLLAGCDYLDIVPEDDTLSIEKIFQTRSSAEQWLSDTYAAYNSELNHQNINPAILGADEYVTSDYGRNDRILTIFDIPDGLQNALEPCNDIWAYNAQYQYIRYCNTFLKNIGNVGNLWDGELEEWTAYAKAIKAFYYFELLKRYGPFVLVPENIDVWASLDEMRQPRSSVNECFDAIIQLLNEAIPDLPMIADMNAEMKQLFFSKEAAMGLKVRVLLTAASPLFNGGVPQYRDMKNRDGKLLFPQEEDKEKWRIAAEYADEAIDFFENRGYRLVEGNSTESSKLLNTIRDLELSNYEESNWKPSTESIWLTSVSADFWQYTAPKLGVVSTDPYYTSIAYGCLSASMKMVNKFYTANGVPIEEDKTWPYGNGYQMAIEKDAGYTNVVPLEEEVLALHLRREPRFYATIAAPGCYWKVSNANLKVDTRQGQLFGLKELRIDASQGQNITGYWIKKGIRSEFSLKEYFDNYKTSVGTGDVVMRLAEVYLSAAEAWNEYEGPNGAHHDQIFDRLNAIRQRAGIPTVQDAWGTYGTNPTKYNEQVGLRDIIRRERTIELMFEGIRFWDIRRWGAGLSEGLDQRPMGWKVTGKTWQEFYNNFQGPVEVWNKAAFNPNRDYFWPIRSEEVSIAGIVQNPGW